MRVLINTPSLSKEGGVAQYNNSLKDFMHSSRDYFFIGSRSGSESWYGAIGRFIVDYVRFVTKLINEEYDLVHLNPSLASKAIIRDGIFLMIAKAFGKKVVVFNHGWDERFELKIRRCFSSLFRIVYSRADAFVVLSSVFKSKLIDMGFSRTIYVETTAVDEGLFGFGSDALEARNGKPDNNNFTVLFLSRLEIGKGVYESLDAFHNLKKRHPGATMVFAGDGTELAKLREYASNNQMTDVVFTGYVTGQAKLEAFSCADVYLFPSWSEGMPISVLEAMTFGLPVVTRPVGGLPDFFEDGKMGFITESQDPSVIADFLEQLIENPNMRRNMGVYNQRYAEEHFRPAVIAGRLEDIYRDVLAREGR